MIVTIFASVKTPAQSSELRKIGGLSCAPVLEV